MFFKLGIQGNFNNYFKENFINNDNGFRRICHINLDALNKHAPCKKKPARGNQMPFLNKELSNNDTN